MEWLPERLYLDANDEGGAGGHRPLNQGDVFASLPLPSAAKYPKDAGGHRVRVPERHAIITTHPCSARKAGGGQLNSELSVCPVIQADSAAPGWGPPWEGHYSLFPLPDLLGDGVTMAADLARPTSVRPDYLTRRLAVLSLQGLAALQERLNRSATRVEENVPAAISRLRSIWTEFDLWQQWVDARGTEGGFQAWLDQPSRERPQSSRRSILKFLGDTVQEELDEELGRGY